MEAGRPRGRAGIEYERRSSRARRAANREPRPDRLAFWAVMLAVIAMIAGAASARAGTGGIGGGGSGGTGGGGSQSCPSPDFGKRTLRLGDCGGDVKTLNWVLRANSLGAPLKRTFGARTDRSVRRFQRGHHLPATGIVRDPTVDALKHEMRHQKATWYNLSGRTTACGQRLRNRTLGVAHRSLPCGTKVVIGYRGHWVRTKVIDRGPYAKGAKGAIAKGAPTTKHAYDRDWDMTQRVAHRLHFEAVGVDKVHVAVIR
jgi:hypothetical protein